MRFIDIIKVIGLFLSGVATFLFGAWDTAIQVLCVLVIMDYLTGLAVAFITHEVSSARGFQGLVKKCIIFFLIALAAMVDKVMPTNGAIRIVVIMAFIANEGVSIIENAAKLGVPVPKKLVEALAQWKDKGEE